MRIDVWSDIRCPFCYVGKHNLEEAISRFEEKGNVEVIWHSFQLDPNLKTQPQKDMLDFFSELKGVPRDQAELMLGGAKQMGAAMGLDFNIENAIVANSFLAHQLLQFAKTKGRGNQVKEALLRAHFTDAKNIDDITVLIDLAEDSGLEREETDKILRDKTFAPQVLEDQKIAQKIGVRGVPFFVFNKKHSVSGAQPPEKFLEVLEMSWKENITS